MNSDIKKIVSGFIKQYNLKNINYSVLKKAAADMGYTVIEFNSVLNDNDTDVIIQSLELSEHILHSKGFTYVSKEYRLIFINENLSEDEKLLIISHEMGHIVCDHFDAIPIIGKDVRDEHEANEFSHYLLKKSVFGKISSYIAMHRKAAVIGAVIIILTFGSVCGYMVFKSRDMYTDNLYITSTGKCYHKKECIFVKNKTNAQKLTKDAFESGEYTPCDMCLPE